MILASSAVVGLPRMPDVHFALKLPPSSSSGAKIDLGFWSLFAGDSDALSRLNSHMVRVHPAPVFPEMEYVTNQIRHVRFLHDRYGLSPTSIAWNWQRA